MLFVRTVAEPHLSRAHIAGIAVQNHLNDPASRLIDDILTPVEKGIPNTEKAVEALLLQLKGPYEPPVIRKIMSILMDKENFSLNKNSTYTKEENAQILGYLAVDLARFHPKTPNLKEIIEDRIKEMEEDGYLLHSKDKLDNPNPQFSRFVAALHYVSSTSALSIMRNHNIDPRTILDLENEAYP